MGDITPAGITGEETTAERHRPRYIMRRILNALSWEKGMRFGEAASRGAGLRVTVTIEGKRWDISVTPMKD